MEVPDHGAYAAGWLLLGLVRGVSDKTISREFDEWGICQVLRDDIEVTREQGEQGAVLDVASGDNEQRTRSAGEQVAVSKVSILGDNDPLVAVGAARYFRVSRSVAGRQCGYMNRIVSCCSQQHRQGAGQLCVDEELHAASKGRTRRCPVASAPNSRAASRSARSRSG